MARHKRLDDFEEQVRRDREAGMTLAAISKKHKIGWRHLKVVLAGDPYPCRRNIYSCGPEITVLTIKSVNRPAVEVLIDTDQVPKVRAFPTQWRLQVNSDGYQMIVGNDTSNAKATVVLARYLTEAPKGSVVDHFNTNTLDNRLQNLRITDKSGNGQNRRGATSISSTGIRNVSFDSYRNKYTVRLKVQDGPYKFFGRFDDIRVAEKVAEEARKNYQPMSRESANAA